MSRRKEKKNQVAKNQLEKRIFFIRLRMEFKRPAKKGVTKRFFFFPLFVQPGVSFASQRLINRCRCYFCVCVCVWVFVCVNLSNHLQPVLERKEKKKVHSFILQTSAGIGYDNTFYTVV